MKILYRKGFQRLNPVEEKWENPVPVEWREEVLRKLP
jgi:hypothetical protein